MSGTTNPQAAPSYEFHRRVDPLVYRFEPTAPLAERPTWRRADLPLWLRWQPGTGWCTVDDQGVVNSRPWNVELADQGEQPPLGEWLSKKGDKSYVYDLVRVATQR